MNSSRDILTFFLETLGHGFLNLDCDSCADGNPANITVGFYPGAPASECKDNENRNQADAADNESLRRSVGGMQPAILSTGVAQMVPSARQHPIGSAAIATTGLIYNPSTQYHIENEAAVDGKSRCDAAADGINFGSFSGYLKKDLEKFYRISHEIRPEDSVKIYKRIKELAENTIINKRYSWLGGNCLDFTKEIYDLTSLEKKSLIGIYNFNPVLSLTGINGVAPAYMGIRNVCDIAYQNPALALCTGYALYGIFKWGVNKVSRNISLKIGSKFDPECLTERKQSDLDSIDKTKKKLIETIERLQMPLKKARKAHNRLYGNCESAAEKKEFEKIGNYYRSVRDLIKNCEETLVKVNQLEKDYLSLFTEIRTLNEAREIINGVLNLVIIGMKLDEIMSNLRIDEDQINFRVRNGK